MQCRVALVIPQLWVRVAAQQRTDHTGAVAFGGQVQRAAAVVTQLGLVLEADGWGPVGDGGCEDGYKQDLF